MKETTSREQILKRIRNAEMQKADNPYADVDLSKNIYYDLKEDLEVVFAEELNHIGGHFVYCMSKEELIENLKRLIISQKWNTVYTHNKEIDNILKSIDIASANDTDDYSKIEVSITECEALIARLGSIMVSSKQINGRRLNFIPDTHIVIANRKQIVATVKDAIELIDNKYEDEFPSMTTIITGPSRTADIEKTLVMGAHGPRTLIVFVTEEDFLN